MKSTRHRAILTASIAAVITTAVFHTVAPALGSSSLEPCGKNLIVNGSFEQGPEPGSYTRLSAGSTAIVGWTVTKGTIDYIGSLWTASDGSRSIDMDGDSSGGISQSFQSIPRRTYVVKFNLAGNQDGPPTVKRLQVAAAGRAAQFTFNISGTTHANMGWQAHSWRFVAKSASTTLGFGSRLSNGYGPVLDHVRVQLMCKR